jgi:hypothetical protein
MNISDAIRWTEESDIFMARGYPSETQSALIATHEALLEGFARERALIKLIADTLKYVHCPEQRDKLKALLPTKETAVDKHGTDKKIDSK